MAKYYIVVGTHCYHKHVEMLFGDYDKQVAEDERDDLKDGDVGGDYKNIRVITLPKDDQATIDAKLAELNKGK